MYGPFPCRNLHFEVNSTLIDLRIWIRQRDLWQYLPKQHEYEQVLRELGLEVSPFLRLSSQRCHEPKSRCPNCGIHR